MFDECQKPIRRTGAGLSVVALTAGLIAAPLSMASALDPHDVAVRLTAGHDAGAGLGGGTALIMGPSMIPTPTQQYVDTVDRLYLQPHGFTGTAIALTTPESPYNLYQSEMAGAQILTAAIQQQIATGDVDAANPVVVFGYSQSAALTTFTMEQLHEAGVPSDYVHFILVGNPAAPNGGWLTSIDLPAGTDTLVPFLNIPLGNATPDSLYPTDVYTIEYDGYADHPHHSMNLLAVLNSYLGLLFQHTGYLGLTPDQLANAVALPAAGEGLTNYYMIPSDSLPLLAPLQLMPVLGQPLYDLLEPTTRILVNLGFGDMAHGWDPGPPNVVTTDNMFFTDVNFADVLTALSAASTQGVAAFAAAMADPATYQMTLSADTPVLASLAASAYGAGIIDTPEVSSVSALVSAFLAASAGSMAAIEPWAPAGF